MQDLEALKLVVDLAQNVVGTDRKSPKAKAVIQIQKLISRISGHSEEIIYETAESAMRDAGYAVIARIDHGLVRDRLKEKGFTLLALNASNADVVDAIDFIAPVLPDEETLEALVDAATKHLVETAGMKWS